MFKIRVHGDQIVDGPDRETVEIALRCTREDSESLARLLSAKIGDAQVNDPIEHQGCISLTVGSRSPIQAVRKTLHRRIVRALKNSDRVEFISAERKPHSARGAGSPQVLAPQAPH